MPSKADRIATIIDTITSEDFGEVAERLRELAATVEAADELTITISSIAGSALVSHESREWDARNEELSEVYDNVERLAKFVLELRPEVDEVLDALEALIGKDGNTADSIISKVTKNILAVQEEIDHLV